MSKTLEMWASDDFIKSVEDNTVTATDIKRSNYYKNKITITIHEERKVTLTEDEFDKMFNDIASVTFTDGISGTNGYLKSRLFKKQD